MKKYTIPFVTGLIICLTLPSVTTISGLSQLRAGEWVAPVQTGCRCHSCRAGKRKKCCRKCPRCNADVCHLKGEKVKVKKTCFEVDQKIVCIPRVTFPWQRCGPTCSKTRTVKVLSKKEYECKECKYTWSLNEPSLPKSSESGPELPDFEGSGSKDNGANSLQFEDGQLDQGSGSRVPSSRNQRELFDPLGSDVPAPPVTRRLNNK